MDQLAFGLTYALVAGPCTLAVGLIGKAAMNAIGRNPEATNELRTMMILAISFADALAIIGLVVALIEKFLK
jgi:F-type H+-transporting ATPase subunit c